MQQIEQPHLASSNSSHNFPGGIYASVPLSHTYTRLYTRLYIYTYVEVPIGCGVVLMAVGTLFRILFLSE